MRLFEYDDYIPFVNVPLSAIHKYPNIGYDASVYIKPKPLLIMTWKYVI